MKRKIFSRALFAENLKRYWSLSALGFVVLFMSLPFIILRSLNENYSYYSYYDYASSLQNHNFGFMLVNLFLPIALAVTLFAYLFKVNSVNTLHAMPFSRTTLYVTQWVSGMSLAFIPYILNALIILALKQPAAAVSDISGICNIYTTSDVLSWLLNSFSIIIFMFSVSVLGCLISGNGVIAALTGFSLNFLLPGLYLVCSAYMEEFITGYTGNNIDEVAIRFTPYLRVFDDYFTATAQIFYIVIALAVSILGWYAYYQRKLERCGDAYVFRWVETVIGFIFVFVISSGCGLLLYQDMGIVAYIIGGVLGFIIGQMITRKTFRLINRRTLKNFIIFALLMVVVISAFAVDLFGIEKKVPSLGSIKSAEVDGYYIRLGNGYYNGLPANTEEDIETVRSFHKSLLELCLNKNQDFECGNYITIEYYLNNGTHMEREYYVSDEYLKYNDDFKKLLCSESVLRKIDTLDSIDESKTSFVFYNGCADRRSDVLALTDTQKRELLDAIKADSLYCLKNAVSSTDGIILADIQMEYDCGFTEHDEAMEYYEDIIGYSYTDSYSDGNHICGHFEYYATSSSENVIAWAKKYGFDKGEAIGVPENSYLVITDNPDSLYEMTMQNLNQPGAADPTALVAGEQQFVCITDNRLANDILLNSSVFSVDECDGGEDNAFWAGILTDEEGYLTVSYTMYVDYTKLPDSVRTEVDCKLK